tara:strand:+ start:292 stop:507 length:216 start_codon:yes stop_codon:yes gene_type:complete
MVKQLTDYKVKELKKVLTDYNKSVRKLTYKAVAKMKKADVVNKLNQDFNPVLGTNKINLKHKSGRFTRRLK